jgi:uncharacterized protein (DUF362 family)
MMKVRRKNFIRVVVLLCFLTVWFIWDLSQASKHLDTLYRSFKMASEYDAVTNATTKVSIVRSDDTNLAHPTSISDANINYQTIEEMVRRAVELAGGFDWLIKSGNMVLLKPNIVDPEPPGTGEITDVKVIKALIKIIDEIDHGKIEIVVGEGSPREMDYELPYSRKTSPRWEKLWDIAGFQDLLTDPYLAGINFRLSNLNGSPPESPWDDLVLVDVPNGGEASPQGGQYYVHKDVLNADVYITVPVMKIHNPGITVALKNQIGLAPSTMYGFSKSSGVPQDNYTRRLTHNSQAPLYWTDKEIVDLSNIANIKFTVVDAIACLETKKAAMRSGSEITNLVRMNMIVAGPDPVAVDHVSCRLMGLNPDDIEHVTLAEKVGLGTNNPDNIEIVGADLDQTMKQFKKTQDDAGHFGQTNRTWLLKGPYSVEGIDDPISHEFIPDEANIIAEAGKDNWSEPVYFINDHIDLEDYFALGYSDAAVSYAFCYFNALKDQTAHLWIGSDEGLIIYINGEEVYKYTGTRSFSGNKFLSAISIVNIKAGENTLLIKSLQKYGRYDFCLNICEPESNVNFNGNRVWGLKFNTGSSGTGIKQQNEITDLKYKISDAYPNPFNNSVTVNYQLSKQGRMMIDVYNVMGQKVRTLLDGKIKMIGNKSVSWDGMNDEGFPVSTGTYLITFKGFGQGMASKKVVLVK